MRNRKNNKKVIVLVVILLLLSISIGYAYLTKILKINNTANIAKTTWDVHFENVVVSEGSVEGTPIIDGTKTTVSLNVNFVNPGDFFEYTVDVVNGGSIDAMVSTLPNALTEEQAEYLEYSIMYSDDTEINPYDELLAGDKDTIRVRISLKDEGIPDNLNFTIETSMNYVQKDENAKPRKKGPSLYNVLSENAIDDTSINFGAISSDTNGKGIYRLTKIETSTPIYYYRGEVDNNVIFGGFCWKIIRTTETGGTKLIYNGVPNEGVCDATGDATEIGKSTYNAADDDLKYFGYMYDDNTKDSAIKSIIDEWFANNLLNYQDYLEDTPFYNERDYIQGDDDPIIFAPGVRLWGTKNEDEQLVHQNPSIKLGAKSKEDIFTVSSEVGNGELTYPIGLLTSDEIVMAGATGWINVTGYTGTNTTYYLYTGSKYWSMSPHCESQWNDINYQMIGVCDNGRYCNLEIKKQNEGVRPVISLKPGTNYLSGNGTKESPYVITK